MATPTKVKVVVSEGRSVSTSSIKVPSASLEIDEVHGVSEAVLLGSMVVTVYSTPNVEGTNVDLSQVPFIVGSI